MRLARLVANLLVIFIFLLLVRPASADNKELRDEVSPPTTTTPIPSTTTTPTANPSPTITQTENGMNANINNYTDKENGAQILRNLSFGVLCEITGFSALPGKYCPADTVTSDGKELKTKLMVYRQVPGGGLIGGTTQMVAALYSTPLLSTTQYLARMGQDFGLIKPAYAQSVIGSGAGIITPVLELWTVTRNLAYLGFIIVFMVTGFMIMFRQKINPQTVISIQAALPKLVVGLALVTFSYFISAVIVDSSFVGVQVVSRTFDLIKNKDGSTKNAFDIATLANQSNILDLFLSSYERTSSFYSDGTRSDISYGVSGALDSAGVGTAAGALVGSVAGYVVGGLIGLLFGPFGAIIAPFGVGALGGIGGALGGSSLVGSIAGFLVPLILIVALTFQFIKLFFKLLNAYITILVTTLISPFTILSSSLPGNGKGLESWWKTLLANSLIFPAVIGAFAFAGVILVTDSDAWKVVPPLFGNVQTNIVKILLGYAVLLALPSIPDAVKAALGVKDNDLIAQTASGAFQSGYGAIKDASSKAVEVPKNFLDARKKDNEDKRRKAAEQNAMEQQNRFINVLNNYPQTPPTNTTTPPTNTTTPPTNTTPQDNTTTSPTNTTTSPTNTTTSPTNTTPQDNSAFYG